MDNTKMALNTVAPVEEIRAHFPALERVHNGFPVAYFDGPGERRFLAWSSRR